MKIEMVVHSPSSSPSWSSAQLSSRSSSGQEGGGQCHACPRGDSLGDSHSPLLPQAPASAPPALQLGSGRWGTPSLSALPCAGTLLGEGALTGTCPLPPGARSESPTPQNLASIPCGALGLLMLGINILPDGASPGLRPGPQGGSQAS